MKLVTQLSVLTLILFGLSALTSCESTELKDGADDVVDVMRNGVDVITDTGKKAAEAVKNATQ